MVERLSALFPGMLVIEHQKNIQFSIKGHIEGLPVQYLFQIIDELPNPEKNLIEHFTSLIEQRKLSKCYLVHKHNIKRSILSQARFYGIEFIQAGVLMSDDFLIVPEVPVKYFHPSLRSAEIDQTFVYTNEMRINPPSNIIARREDHGVISLDEGQNRIALSDFIVTKYLEKQPNLQKFEKLDLSDELMWMRLNDRWLSTNVVVQFKWTKPAYLIYFTAAELKPYAGQWKKKANERDIKVEGLNLPPESRWIRIGNPYLIPVKTNLLYEGRYELPENMAEWIAQNLTYNND